jgi:acyl-CoA reductase-like NAD-dependent aldehyde dehydrogenase
MVDVSSVVDTMTIGGTAATADATFDVVNPATGEPFATAPDCTEDQLDRAVRSAADAFGSWCVDEDARRQALATAAEQLKAAADDLAPVLSAEQGKPVSDARGEVLGAAAWCQYFASLELPSEVVQDDDRAFVEVVRRPLGVVAAITPWNFPVSLAAWKLAPALLAGNTVVLKPSPYTPLSNLALGALLCDVVPPGVLNVISGRDPLGAWMTAHPLVRKISFTGSVATGKKVAAAAAPDLKRVTLELGGNDPAVLLDDVDPGAIADALFWSAFGNNGQVCSAIKRIYAPEAIYGDVVDALAERARAVRVGAGTDEGVQLGPINNRPHLERVVELVADALANGAEAAAGGHRMDRPGYFFEPTILAGASDGSRIVDEEQFGPVLPVVAYRDLDDAVARANATHFGLGASVWGADADRAAHVARGLEAGTVWVNTHLQIKPRQPFGGLKWSGIGVENGPWGYYAFTDIQTVYVAR